MAKKAPVQYRRWLWSNAWRLGSTVKYVKERWGEVRDALDAYKSWRNRYIKNLQKKTGLTQHQLAEYSAIPPRIGARLEEMESLGDITRLLKQLKKTRAVWNAKRDIPQYAESVRRRSEREAERAAHELRGAQEVLMSRLDAAVAMDSETWDQMMEIVSRMTDTDIVEFYAADDGILFQILRISSPKLMARKNAIPEEVDADTNEARIAYFRNVLLSTLGEADLSVKLQSKIRKKLPEKEEKK